MTKSADIAERARRHRLAYLGFSLAVMPLMDERHPLADVWHQLYEIPPSAPFEVNRVDGSTHSAEPIGAILEQVAALPGAGLGEDLLAIVAMHSATRLGDDLLRGGLMRTDEPLLQFARHLRNACAHGNRWNFQGDQPKHPAALRGRSLDASLNGTKAIMGWLGPGDFLDFLEDLVALVD
jgi:hypothetical protein